MRNYDVCLVILGICGVLALGFGDLVIALFFSIIGIPIGFLLLALPSLALILCPARLIDRLVLVRVLPKGISGYAAVGVVLASLACLSFVANARQTAEIETLLAGDHDDLTRPLPDQTYAYLSKETGEICTEFCQRLLLTGQARAVLLAQADAQTIPAATTPATLWQFKDQPTCPAVTLPAGGGLFIPGDENAIKVNLRMGEHIAAGHCLISSPATLAAADAVILDVTLRTRAWDPGFSWGENQISATRRSVWLKADPGFVENARWTHVAAMRMFALALPVLNPGMNTKHRIGFWRVSANRGYGPGFAAFVTDSLGLKLRLKALPSVKTASGEDPLLAALKTAGPLDSNTLQLAIARLETISRAETTTPDDQALLITLLSDPRAAVVWQYEAATRTLRRSAPPKFSADVAEVGFARLARVLLPDQHLDSMNQKDYYARLKQINPVKAQIKMLGTLLSALPDDVLQPYRAQIFALAADRQNRGDAYALLARLSAFGDDGARALVDLLADPLIAGQDNRLNARDIYGAAILGLCEMGPRAGLVLPQLLDLAKSGKIYLSDGSEGMMAALTLLRLGQPAETILPLAEAMKYPMGPLTLEMAKRRGAKDRPCAL